MSRSRARQIHCETAVPCVVQCVECNTSVLKHKWQARWQPSPSPRSSFRACASSRPWCASIQSRVESTVHRRSRANFRNLVSPRMRRRQIFSSATSPQTDQTRSGCATSLTLRQMKASSISRALMDAWSRSNWDGHGIVMGWSWDSHGMVMGWSMSNTLHATIATDALMMAVKRRSPPIALVLVA